MAIGDVEYDCPCLEQGEVVFLIGRNLAERMKRQMRGFLHRSERHKANLVRLPHFFKRPAHARITRQSLAAIGRAFKRGNGDGHREAPPWPKSSAAGLEAVKANLPRLKMTQFYGNRIKWPKGELD
jgi:hypothetical protein